ncbi:asparagine synthase-related protein [Streptomyces griseocarneus]|uniref:asparagine synthase-related protein n=1 Tax=Streptomyces griseocarneus TaxID=51201 RepID=UPI001CCDE3B5|nr:asparagine synthase-related protein [Streptomyces griseocarneus]MBZ6473097.1 asparagine synthase [Streptomyces griseocarneus]
MTPVSPDVSFVALPDSAAGSAAAAAVPAPGPRVINHASGRPWLMGRWPADAVKVVTAGRARVVVAGFCPLTTAELAACAARLTGGVAGLDDLARRLRGSAHLMASVGGRVRVQGGVAGVRSVYRARIAGVTVAADRPDALSSATGSAVDERLVGLRLLTPSVPHPLRERTPWCGVAAVPPGSYLTIEPDGTARTVRWWTPPAPELGLEDGAPAVRDALTDAVRTRLRALGEGDGGSGAPAIGVALPGSMESAVLAHLAASGDHRLITVRTARLDPGGDDAPWTRRIAARLPRTEHVVLEYAHAPALYAGLDRGAGVLPAEPPHRVRAGARLEHTAREVASRGARLYLCAHGGDELFAPPAPYLHTLARSRPLAALRRIRGRRALTRWPLGATWRALADSRGFPAWLTHSALRLTAPPPRPCHPQLGWTAELRMPRWATPDAVDAVHEMITDASYEPLAPDRGAHSALDAIRRAGAATGYATRQMAAHGVDLAAPFLDDRVIEAALAVRPCERAAPHGRRKPLLAAAVRDLAPDDVLGRAPRGHYGEDVMDGMRRHRRALLELFDGSELGRMGLVDDAAVRAALRTTPATVGPLLALEPTLACEAWLRTLAAGRPREGATP